MLDFVTKYRQSMRRALGIETILSVIAIALTIGVFLKVILDVDNNYDPGYKMKTFIINLYTLHYRS